MVLLTSFDIWSPWRKAKMCAITSSCTKCQCFRTTPAVKPSAPGALDGFVSKSAFCTWLASMAYKASHSSVLLLWLEPSQEAWTLMFSCAVKRARSKPLIWSFICYMFSNTTPSTLVSTLIWFWLRLVEARAWKKSIAISFPQPFHPLPLLCHNFLFTKQFSQPPCQFFLALWGAPIERSSTFLLKSLAGLLYPPANITKLLRTPAQQAHLHMRNALFKPMIPSVLAPACQPSLPWPPACNCPLDAMRLRT